MSAPFDLAPRHLSSDLTSLLQLFLGQLSAVRSIIAIDLPWLSQSGEDAVLFRVTGDGTGISATPAVGLSPAAEASNGLWKHTLESLSQQADQLCGDSAGDDLLLLPEPTLNEFIALHDVDLSFRAIAVFSSTLAAQSPNENGWRLQRKLFDRGLVSIGTLSLGGLEVRCFLASSALRSLNQVVGASRGRISMSTLGSNGAFANQLFQYAYIKLYALRHGLTAALPRWYGRTLFGLDDDPYCADVLLPKMGFNGFTDDDRRLWEVDDPPVDLDLCGFFQETPECWRRHRPLLRLLFELSAKSTNSLDAWYNNVTRHGERTLVAVHVRRGDYRNHDAPWFRLVPEDYYLEWLRGIWPNLREPLLFVATDEPDVILPRFEEFTPTAASLPQLPDHVRDFEILRRADYLAICNSSFSRMAAILAPSTQRCFLPSFEMRCFEAYEPWIDPGFWARFAGRSEVERRPDATSIVRGALRGDTLQPTIYFDVSDLVLYLLDHTTLSGIQRVQCEIVRHLVDLPDSGSICFVALSEGGSLASIEVAALLEVIDLFRSVAASLSEVRLKVRALRRGALPCTPQPGDVFLTIGAFWGVGGMGRHLQRLKNSGVRVAVFVHDIIPITDPEYFQSRDIKVFVKGVVEALTFADFLLTTSAYNGASLSAYCGARNLHPLPIHLVPLAHELSRPVTAAEVSDAVAAIMSSEYVLCVGTIEIRKNPTYLFNIWKKMVQSGRSNIPTLVFAGRQGWLVGDFIEQLKACHYLGGRIVVLHNVTDAELDQLYRGCLLTMFPSFAEGWGLPVGESLAYGKISLCATAGGIPEVGGACADYIDPFNACDGLTQLSRYLDDPELRRRREGEIADHFKPRSWRQVAEDLLASTRSLLGQLGQIEGVAAITLPPNQFLPITANMRDMPLEGIDGSLSAELACVSGWRPPEIFGASADEAVATLRFRAALPAGSRIHVVLRLGSADGRYYRIHVLSGSGAEVSLSLGGEADSLVTLSCEVEPGNLVNATLSLLGTSDGQMVRGPFWQLKGILYFQPAGLVDEGRKTAAAALKDLSLDDFSSASMESRSRLGPPPLQDRVRLTPLQQRGQSQASLAAFLQSTNSYWPSATQVYRNAPIFVDGADAQIFYTRYRNSQIAPVGAVADNVTLIRRSNQYISMSRFTEGAVFDETGVSRAFGYIQGAPPETAWLSRDADAIWVDKKSLSEAPFYDKSCLIFYNGNLHNYYHWIAEGLLSLDILAGIGATPNVRIALPKSMDVNALIDHRGTLRALGFDTIESVEFGDKIIKVREAIWVHSEDFIERAPASYLKDFQQRIASKYADAGGSRSKRLLIERKGPTRKIENFEQVQEFLAQQGFETIILEGMSIVEQILLFQNAEFVIGTHGAGLTNLLFCEPGTKVIEFMPSIEMRPFFWLISDKLNLTHAVQFCAAAGDEGFQANLNVDVEKLEALYRIVAAKGCAHVTLNLAAV